jgi:hypothetical protein
MRRFIALALALAAFLVACEQTVEEGLTPAPLAETPTATRVADEPPATREAATPEPTPTPTGESVLFRWVNVTLELPVDPAAKPWYELRPSEAFPAGSGLWIGRDFAGVDVARPFIVVASQDDPESYLTITADTGEITKDTMSAEDRAAADYVLNTMRVTPFDPKVLPWPYNGSPPDVPPIKIGNITYIPPDPAAGISITFGISEPGGDFLEINNGRSLVFVDLDTGFYQWEPAFLVPEDKQILERFLSSVEHRGGPVKEYLGTPVAPPTAEQ